MAHEKQSRVGSAWMHRTRVMGWWLLLLAGIGGVSLLLLLFAGVFHTKVDGGKSQRLNPLPANGQYIEAVMVTQPRYETAIGTIRPVHEANVASKIMARVLEINVTAGKRVQAGEVLVRLSDEEQRSRVQQAEAERDSAVAQLQLAKTELARARQLVSTRSISQADLETAETRFQTTQASADRAERTVEEARIYLNEATVLAPFAGIVVDKTVQPGDTVAPGQVMLSLYDPSQMQLVASVRESLAKRLQVGQMLMARLESLGFECQATISEMVPKADISSRSFEVKVTGPCPAGVYSGMFGRLMLPLDDEQLLLIPVNTIQRVGQLTYVQVASSEQLVRRSVQVGRVFDERVEILAGIQVGERVFVPNSATAGETR